jgi:hypothetical protein
MAAWKRRLCFVFILVLTLVPFTSTQAGGPISNFIIVTTLEFRGTLDDGFCSLWEAITNANIDDAISFAPGECEAGLDSSDEIVFDVFGVIDSTGDATPPIIDNLVVTGSGADKLLLVADETAYHFYVATEEFAVSDLSMTGGYAGIWTDFPVVFVSVVSVYMFDIDGYFDGTDQVGRAGISMNSPDSFLIMADTTIAYNGPSTFGRGIYTEGLAFLINNTIYDNDTTMAFGAGVQANGPGAAVFHLHNTIAENSGPSGFGSGVYALDGGSHAFANSIVANNDPAGGNCAVGDMDSTIQSLGSNLSFGDATCDTFFTEAGDQNADPVFDFDLAQNGGTIPTLALLPGSAAIDAGDASLISASDDFDCDGDFDSDEPWACDARGTGYVREYGAAPDAGAYEAQAALQIVNYGVPGLLYADRLIVSEGTTIGDQIAVRLLGVNGPAGDVDVEFIDLSPTAQQVTFDNYSTPAIEAAPTVTVTFTPANWEDFQIINIGALNEGIPEGAHAALLGFQAYDESIDPSFDNYSQVFDVVAAEIREPGVVFAYAGTTLVEGGPALSYDVFLNAPPGIAATTSTNGVPEVVRVRLVNYNTRLLQANPTEVIFTRDDCGCGVPITVFAPNDSIDRGVRYAVSVSHTTLSNSPTTAGGSTSLYGGALPNLSPARLRFTITDNDWRDGTAQTEAYYDALNLAAWLEVTATGAVIVEGSSAPALSVALNGQPAPGEVVFVELYAGDDVTLTPSVLLFDETNWNIPQIVSVAVADDGIVSGQREIAVQVIVGIASTSADFLGAAQAVTLPVSDNGSAPGLPVEPLMAEPFAPVPEGSGETGEGTMSE